MLYFSFFFSNVFWNERAWYGGKRGKKMWKLPREMGWEGKGCGFEGGATSTNCRLTAPTSSSWPKTCLFHPHTRSCFSLWWPECQKRDTSFLLSFTLFYFIFLVVSNRRTFPLLALVLFSLHGFNCQSDHTVSSLVIISSLSLLAHWRQGLHKWRVISVCLYHCLPALLWSLDRSLVCLYHCLPPSSDLWIEILCSCPVHTVHRADCVIADHVITIRVLACRHEVHPHNTQTIRARGQGKRAISHHPAVSTVGVLFIVYDLTLVGAKMQAQWQIGCLVPHSKPSLRDARWPDT